MPRLKTLLLEWALETAENSPFCERTTNPTAGCTSRNQTTEFSRLEGTSTFIGNTESMPCPRKNKKRTVSTRGASVLFYGALQPIARKKRTLHRSLERTGKDLMQQKTTTNTKVAVTRKIEGDETIKPFTRNTIPAPKTTCSSSSNYNDDNLKWSDVVRITRELFKLPLFKVQTRNFSNYDVMQTPTSSTSSSTSGNYVQLVQVIYWYHSNKSWVHASSPFEAKTRTF